MSGVYAEIVALWQDQLAVFGLVFLRIGAMMALLPAFGERSVPVRIRLVVALVFTALIVPVVGDGFASPDGPSTAARTAAIEILAGLAIGILFRLAVLVLQIAGTIAANVTSLAQVFGGSAVDPQPAMAHILVLAGLALLTMTGLHVRLVAAMVSSYDLFPPGEAIGAAGIAAWGTGEVTRAFALAFSLSAPFLIASVIYNLALGAINRAMPQLMVAFVGAPAITAASILLLFLSAPFMLGLWLRAFGDLLAGIGAG